MGCRIERNFLSAFLAMLNKALRSLLPGCKGGNVESKMNSVNGVESSCQQRVEIITLVVLVWVVTIGLGGDSPFSLRPECPISSSPRSPVFDRRW